MWILARRGGPGVCEGVRSLPVVTGENGSVGIVAGSDPDVEQRNRFLLAVLAGGGATR